LKCVQEYKQRLRINNNRVLKTLKTLKPKQKGPLWETTTNERNTIRDTLLHLQNPSSRNLKIPVLSPPARPTKKIKKTEDRYIVYPSPQTQPCEEETAKKETEKGKKFKKKRTHFKFNGLLVLVPTKTK
jgi:hypothetical protein